jgi:hypothetical protein
MVDQFLAMQTCMAEQEQQQITLNLTVKCVETALHDQPPRGAPHHRCDADEDDPGDDFIPMVHKLEFTKFDGTCDPLPWLNRCERYFRVRRTPEHKRVAYAAFHLLENAKLWFHHLELNGGQPTWNCFTQLTNARFGPSLTDSPIDELVLLRRTDSVDDYCNQFTFLSCLTHL